MLTEFEVRREMEAIMESNATPQLKVRRLLSLIRPVKLRFRALVHSHNVVVRANDGVAVAHLDRLIMRLQGLYDEVRMAAYSVLDSGRQGIAFA